MAFSRILVGALEYGLMTLIAMGGAYIRTQHSALKSMINFSNISMAHAQ
jgi:hypothetical protein